MSKDVDVDLLTTCRTCLEVNVERKGYMALFTPTNSLKVAPNNVLVELDSFQLGVSTISTSEFVLSTAYSAFIR